MQFQRDFGRAIMVLFTAGCFGCAHTQPIPALKPDENLAVQGHSTTPASPSPNNTANPLPPNARQIPVSDGVIQGMAIQKVQPEYPLEAQAKGITGEVKIRVSINQEGHLAEAVALNGHPLLQAAALAAAKQWRWRPHAYDGPPLYTQGTLTFHFPPRS
jgi:protein TonB